MLPEGFWLPGNWNPGLHLLCEEQSGGGGGEGSFPACRCPPGPPRGCSPVASRPRCMPAVSTRSSGCVLLPLFTSRVAPELSQNAAFTTSKVEWNYKPLCRRTLCSRHLLRRVRRVL